MFVSFRFGDYKFNVEVKCANSKKKHAVDDGEGFKTGVHGRLSDFKYLSENLTEAFASVGSLLSEQRHMDINLKDFLLSADGKFSAVTSDKELNVLVVACDDAMDMQKWYSYLHGPQGLFTPESYVDASGYNKVDMVLLTNLYHRHKDLALKNKLVGHWELNQAFSILCHNPKSLKPNKTFHMFSGTVQHYNDQLHSHVVEGDAPDFI